MVEGMYVMSLMNDEPTPALCNISVHMVDNDVPWELLL